VCSVGFLWLAIGRQVRFSFKMSIMNFAYPVTVLRKSFLAAARIRAAGFAITTISVARFLDRLGP
jgi:hypothetical protein